MPPKLPYELPAPTTPSLTLKAATSRVKRNNTSGFSITSSRTERYTPSMDLAWELDIWGAFEIRNFLRMDAEQAAANLQAARLSLAANTAKGWFDQLKPSCKPSSLSKPTKATPTTSPCRGSLQRGLTKALDVRLMRTSARNAESTLPSASANAMPPGGHLRFCWAVIPKAKSPEHRPTHATNAVPAGLPAQLIERRPDVLATQRAYPQPTGEWIAPARIGCPRSPCPPVPALPPAN